MGKTTGFLEYNRQEASSRPPEERVRDWVSFVVKFSDFPHPNQPQGLSISMC